MVNKLRLLKGGSVPTFLVLGRCCTTSLPWTLEEGRRGSQAILGYRRLVQQFQCSMAVLELLARATEAWVVAAGSEHLVNRSSRTVDGVSRRCTAGKPVRMDVAGGWRYQFHERLMSRIGILVSLDQFLQPVPAAFGAVEMDGLEPVGMRFEERLPTRRVECDALDVAAAPLVDNRHSASFVVAC